MTILFQSKVFGEKKNQKFRGNQSDGVPHLRVLVKI